jgi:hypothetical protein
MTAPPTISLFDDQPPTAAERAALDTWTGVEPGEGITAAERRTEPPSPPDDATCPECGAPVIGIGSVTCDTCAGATDVPDLEPGQLVRWTDEGGVPHVGRVESVTGGAAMLTYGPRPHRARIELDELTPIDDKDGAGRPR